MAIDKERRHYLSTANVLTLVAMVGALATVWATNAADNADTKRRVTTLEQGEAKTHALIKENAREIKRDVKETRDSVNQILVEIRQMQAVERDRERAHLERNGR